MVGSVWCKGGSFRALQGLLEREMVAGASEEAQLLRAEMLALERQEAARFKVPLPANTLLPVCHLVQHCSCCCSCCVLISILRPGGGGGLVDGEGGPHYQCHPVAAACAHLRALVPEHAICDVSL